MEDSRFRRSLGEMRIAGSHLWSAGELLLAAMRENTGALLARVLLSAVVFFAAAYRFDNRFVLSLALSTLGAWFGIKLNHLGLRSSDSMRVSALTV